MRFMLYSRNLKHTKGQEHEPGFQQDLSMDASHLPARPWTSCLTTLCLSRCCVAGLRENLSTTSEKHSKRLSAQYSTENTTKAEF